jgi:hypothetical protein
MLTRFRRWLLLVTAVAVVAACVPPQPDYGYHGGNPPHVNPNPHIHSMYEWAYVLVRLHYLDPVTGLAVIWAESHGVDNARNLVRNPGSVADGSWDRGGWQLNSVWHARASDACADEMLCASAYARGISANGSDYRLWTTFVHGSHKVWMNVAAKAVWDATVDFQRTG